MIIGQIVGSRSSGFAAEWGVVSAFLWAIKKECIIMFIVSIIIITSHHSSALRCSIDY